MRKKGKQGQWNRVKEEFLDVACRKKKLIRRIIIINSIINTI